MIKRYCDCCKKEISGKYRRITIGNETGVVDLERGVEIDPKTTMSLRDICIDCAKKIIASFRT